MKNCFDVRGKDRYYINANLLANLLLFVSKLNATPERKIQSVNKSVNKSIYFTNH